jgi:leucyl aminopeptidase
MLNLLATAPGRTPIDFLAIPLCQGADLHGDPTLRAIVAKAAGLEEFTRDKDQQVLLYDLPGTKVRRAWLGGLGTLDELCAERLRVFAGQAVKAALKAKQTRITIALPLVPIPKLERRETAKVLLEGAFLANHTFEKYKGTPKNECLEAIDLLVSPAEAKSFKPLLVEVDAVCSGTLLAREWINTPSNEKTPLQFARLIEDAVAGLNVKHSRLDHARLKKENFGALLAVGAGSSHPPCLVELVYAPAKADRTVVLVGKGITFDTGGLNLKPSDSMATMKSDMSGAAAVAAALTAIARLKPKARVVGILPLVENMPSGQATRPSDIVVSRSGKTIEIGNTDAEGRLILADAMDYARKKYRPDTMIDIATLTGACVVALGDKMAGLFSPDDALAEEIAAAGRRTHERCWRMPLPEDYKELLKSDPADINNLPSTRNGGAITAALFLSEFVGDTRWAHIDIAGPAFSKKGSDYCGPGGAGFGVRLLCDWILSQP